MLKGLYILNAGAFNAIYGEEERREIEALVDVYAPPQTRESVLEHLELLCNVEVIFSGWGGPRIDQAFLDAAPSLKAVFYGAGSIRGIVTDAFWNRGVLITSAYGANGIPVAEYTLSQILFCLKNGWRFVFSIKENKKYDKSIPVTGAYGSTVGIISLGMIGRLVCRMLKPFDLNVIAYDPFVSPESLGDLDVELCSLEDVFKRADVVSLHTPWLKETEGMITGAHFEMMKPNAAFINTARGAVVNELEMIEVLTRRPDIQAVLDVTCPEPPKPESPLYTLPNVVLTPHIAGSMAGECRRMGRFMVEELKRYLNNEPLKWAIDRQKAAILA